MKILRHVSLTLMLATALLANHACSSSSSDAVEEAVDDSGDNQISSETPEPINDSEIPSPDQAADGTAAAGDQAESGVIDSTSTADINALPTDQQAADVLAQSETEAQQTLEQKPAEPTSFPVGLAAAEDDSMVNPAEGNEAAQPEVKHKAHHKGKKAKKGKASRHRQSAQLEGNAGGPSYIVQPGDTLGRIAHLVYGTSSRWRELAQSNGLESSSAIFPGDVIRYAPDSQSAVFESSWGALPKQSIKIEKGDTLFSIATRVMGHSHYWKMLWRMNAEAIPDPHKITPGQNLNYVGAKELTAFFEERKNQGLAH